MARSSPTSGPLSGGFSGGFSTNDKTEGRLGEDESYLVAVSDLMVGLLFLFIIILMAFALNFRSAEDAAEATLEALTAERDALQTERDRIDADRAMLAEDRDRLLAERDRLAGITLTLLQRDAERAELLTRIKAALAARQLEVEVDLENGILRLPESLLFASNEAELSETGRNALGILGDVLAELLPCYAGVPDDAAGERGRREVCPAGSAAILEALLIEGHTDDRPIRSGPFPDNWALSAARARSTYRALLTTAPELDQISNANGEALLGVSGYAARRPVIDASTDEARRVNRRIDLRFLARGPHADALAALLASLQSDDDAP